jgi:subtilisin family serine protease
VIRKIIIALILVLFLVSSFPTFVAEEDDSPEVFLINNTGAIEISKKPPWAGGGGGDDDPAQVLPWGVDRIDAELVSYTGAGVTIAVIDTGIDSNHPDLADNILGGMNYIRKGRKYDPNKWEDDNGHGTHVAGTIAGIDNTIGVIGVAPEAGLYAVKVLDRNGNGNLDNVVSGIRWAIAQDVDIITMSLRTLSHYPEFQDACDDANAAGILVVAAAGNDYNGVAYPAKYPSVIAVSATNSNDNLPAFSNRGPEIDLAAPGVNIYSTWKGDGYNTISGTSMACPHVTGTAALVLEANPGYSNAQVRAQLTGTAEDLGTTGFDNLYGYGLVDAQAAIA